MLTEMPSKDESYFSRTEEPIAFPFFIASICYVWHVDALEWVRAHFLSHFHYFRQAIGVWLERIDKIAPVYPTIKVINYSIYKFLFVNVLEDLIELLIN